ncbi:MAG TPA: hypothetical protein VG848_15685 [Acetobacteraceae bacterium]|nr:hypothetical protein [Acetobacteraceae bacterium]
MSRTVIEILPQILNAGPQHPDTHRALPLVKEIDGKTVVRVGPFAPRDR